MMRGVIQRRRLHRTWTEPAGTVQTFPVIEPDENDGQTWEEMQQAAEIEEARRECAAGESVVFEDAQSAIEWLKEKP